MTSVKRYLPFLSPFSLLSSRYLSLSLPVSHFSSFRWVCSSSVQAVLGKFLSLDPWQHPVFRISETFATATAASTATTTTAANTFSLHYFKYNSCDKDVWPNLYVFFACCCCCCFLSVVWQRWQCVVVVAATAFFFSSFLCNFFPVCPSHTTDAAFQRMFVRKAYLFHYCHGMDEMELTEVLFMWTIFIAAIFYHFCSWWIVPVSCFPSRHVTTQINYSHYQAGCSMQDVIESYTMYQHSLGAEDNLDTDENEDSIKNNDDININNNNALCYLCVPAARSSAHKQHTHHTTHTHHPYTDSRFHGVRHTPHTLTPTTRTYHTVQPQHRLLMGCEEHGWEHCGKNCRPLFATRLLTRFLLSKFKF